MYELTLTSLDLVSSLYRHIFLRSLCMEHFVLYAQGFNVHKHLCFWSNLCYDRALKAIMCLYSQVQTDMEYVFMLQRNECF